MRIRSGHAARGTRPMFSLSPRDTEDTARQTSGANHADQTGASRRSAYDPNLIKHLKADHATLQATLARLEDHAHRCQFAKLPSTLARFHADLLHHIEEEDEHFYGHVSRSLREDPLVSERLDRASARMAGIARMVTLFVRHYTDIGVTSTTRDAFLRDLDVITTLLGDRIELEETSLYALYQPPHRAAELPDEDCLLSLEHTAG
jgi:hypothetical protein